MIFSSKLKINRQSGVTLLLSILILSAILAISFSLATILFIEVRTSGDLLRTEASYYGGQGVTEEALFKVKRQAPLSYTSNFGAVSLGGPAPVETQLTEPIFQDKVDPLMTAQNTPNRYPLFNPNDLTGGSGYSYITITKLPSGNSNPLVVYVCQYDPHDNADTYNPPGEPCTSYDSDSTGYWNLTNARNYSISDTEKSHSWFLNSSMQQQIIIANPASSGKVNFTIQAFAIDGTSIGIPYSGKTAVKIIGGLGGISRKITVVIPNSVANSCLGSSGSSNSSSFVSIDTTSQGNWHGVYGSEGYNVLGGTQNYPAYASLSTTNTLFDNRWTTDPTSDVRALYKDAITNSRFVAYWYNGTWDMNLNITDGLTHKVSLYMVDWDSCGPRSQTLQLIDQSTGNVLDTQTITNFTGGKYYTYNVAGQVTFRFNTILCNAVLSGIFFDSVPGASSSCGATTGTLILQNNTSGGDGTFNFTTSGGPTLPGTTSVTTSGGSGNVTFSDVSAGTYSISQTVPGGWDLTSASCTDGFSAYNYPALTNIQIASGATVTCTFNNNKTVSSGYQHYRKIDVDGSKVIGSNQNGFPVLVCFNGSAPCNQSVPELKNIANGGVVTSSAGNDIIFTSDSGGQNILPFEKEKYVSATGEAIYWVKLSLTQGSPTSFYIFYGNSGDTDHSNKNAVWNSNYKGVWHLDESSGVSVLDSTSNSWNGTKLASNQPNVLSAGKIGAAQSFANRGFWSDYDYINLSSYAHGNANFTTSFWFYVTDAWARIDAFSSSNSSAAALSWAWNSNGSDGVYSVNLNSASYSNNPLIYRSWHYLTTVRTSITNVDTYIDGIKFGSTLGPYDVNRTLTVDFLGQVPGMTSATRIYLDEARFSTVANSAGWIQTEYNNQSSPSTFYTLGAEQ